MTFEQLLTLEAIEESGSFKAASQKLFKSQPSISMAIKKLEEEYGILIYSRDEYRPVLTQEGKIFLSKAKLVLKHMKELEELGKQLGKGEEALIRVSIDAISPLSLILKFLRDFFENYPRTRLEIKFEILNGTIERLVDDEVDLAITSILPKDLDFESMPLTEVRLIPVIHRDLLKKILKEHKAQAITDEMLKKETQIIVADSSRKLRKIDSGIMSEGKSITLTELSFKKEMIDQAMGYGGLPFELVREGLKEKSLVAIDTKQMHERIAKIHILRKKKNSYGPVMCELWKSFKNEF